MNRMLGFAGAAPLVCPAAVDGRAAPNVASASEPAAIPRRKSRRLTCVCSRMVHLPTMCHGSGRLTLDQILRHDRAPHTRRGGQGPPRSPGCLLRPLPLGKPGRLRICALPQGPTGRRALVALHLNNVPPDEAVDPRLLRVAMPDLTVRSDDMVGQGVLEAGRPHLYRHLAFQVLLDWGSGPAPSASPQRRSWPYRTV